MLWSLLSSSVIKLYVFAISNPVCSDSANNENHEPIAHRRRCWLRFGNSADWDRARVCQETGHCPGSIRHPLYSSTNSPGGCIALSMNYYFSAALQKPSETVSGRRRDVGYTGTTSRQITDGTVRYATHSFQRGGIFRLHQSVCFKCCLACQRAAVAANFMRSHVLRNGRGG